MLNDAAGFEEIYIAVGYTDLRCGIDELASTIRFQFNLDPFQKHVLFYSAESEQIELKDLYGKDMVFYFFIKD